MGMKTGHVLPAFPTNKLHFPKNFRGVFLRCKRPITVLLVVGCDDNILSYFDKMLGIATLLTGNASSWFTGGNMDFLHKSQEIALIDSKLPNGLALP
jgi:hypothetical protein